MTQWIIALAALAGGSPPAEQTTDIVLVAASAIVRSDSAALDGMRFQAYGLDRRPMPTVKLTELISGCDALATDASLSRPVRLRYRCASLESPTAECISNVLVVHVDRATSPDVFANLYFERSNAPECRLVAPSAAQ